MALASLPPELILYIGEFLSYSSLNCLIRSQKFFARLLTPALYDPYITFERSITREKEKLIELDPYKLPLEWYQCVNRWQSDVILDYFRKRPVQFLTHTDETGRTLLHISARRGNLSLVKILIQQKDFSIDVKAHNGRTPLFEAISNKEEAMIKWLLNAGADVTAVDASRRSVLEEMALFASGAMVEMVLKKLKKQQQQERKCYKGGSIQHSGDILPQSILNKALCRSLYQGDEHSVRVLLDYGADPSSVDSYGTSVLAMAAIHGNENIIQILLDHHADPLPMDSLGRSAITCAAEGSCSWEITQQIFDAVLDAGGNITNVSDEYSPLNCFAEKGCLPAVRMLLDHNADVLYRILSGTNALHLALYYYSKDPTNYEEVCQLLIKAINTATSDGAKFDHIVPDLMPLKGGTSLHLAAKCGSKGLVGMLLDSGVDANVLDDEGSSAMYIASLEGHEEVFQLLLARSADQNYLTIDFDKFNQ